MTITFILVFSLLLRLISVGQSLWLDEATSATVVRDLSFSQYFGQFAPGDFHPPLYYLLLKLWGTAFGTSEVALRSLSVLLGVGTVYVLYLIGKNLFKERVGLVASLLLAISGLHIYFSQEARMYVLASFLVALSIYFFVKTMKEGGVGQWLGFSFSVAGAAMAHYLAFLMLPVYWLIAKEQKKSSWRKKFFASHNILVIMVLLWSPIFIQQLKSGVGTKTTSPLWWNILGKTSLKEILLVPAKFILGRISIENNVLYLAVLLIVGVVFALAILPALRRFRKIKLVWAWLLLPVLTAALVGLFIPVFSYSRLVFVLPALYLLMSFGLSRLKKVQSNLLLAMILAVNLVTSGVYLTNTKFHREDWRGLVEFIEANSGENAVTLFVANSQMEAYRYYSKTDKISGPNGLGSNFDQIWLMRYVQSLFDPEDILRKNIEGLGYEKVKEYDFNGVVVWKYENRN